MIADAQLAKMLLNSRGLLFLAALSHQSALPIRIRFVTVHSVGRSWLYRFIANLYPDSDGILFLADESWRRRHSAFTPLFTGSNVQRYTLSMLRAAFEIGHRNSLACAIHPGDTSLAVSSAPPGIGDGTCYDLLSAVRCVSMRVLFSWGMGVDANSREATSLADLFDEYARIILEIIPGRPAPNFMLIGSLLAYARTFSIRAALRTQVCKCSRTHNAVCRLRLHPPRVPPPADKVHRRPVPLHRRFYECNRVTGTIAD